ncbi:MAG: hypothetical protein JST92_26705, partial [Deltaproteobacteria bacterium]|nr:hypothetical protein [Deltaproteobacteria bacterium]
TPSSEKIQVVGEVNHYTVEVPQSFAGKRALLRIALSNAAPASPVRLVYLLENTDGSAVLASRGPAKGSGAQSIAGTFLVPGPGTYQLLVRDATNQNKDSNNPYTLSATVLEDPDTAEPDDTPPQARVNQPAAPNAATPEAKSGEIASQGDLDLLQFELTQDGLVHWTVTMAQPTTQLQLRARILKRSTSAPDDVGQATPVAEVDATKAGDALNSDLVRFLAAGKYLVALDDKAGTESDSATTWTTALQLVADPDPNEQTSRNDTAATATTLGVGQSKQGAIGSQGDADWYEIALPTVTTPKIVQLTIDPGGAANDVELDWAVGDVLATPAGACDVSCGPVAFCTASNLCGYAMHALHHFTKGEHAVQSVRLRHMGAARTMRMVVTDQGGDERSNGLYTVSA